MEESQSLVETTGSMCAPQTAQGRHVFEIEGYSLQKGLGVGKFIQSVTFGIGGHHWRIRFYPDGDAEDGKDYVAIFLELMSNTGEVRVLYDFRVVNLETMVPKFVLGVAKPTAFRAPKATMGFRKFMKKTELEAPPFLQDNRVVLVCHVNVVMGTLVSESSTMCGIQVPPSHLVDDLGNFLESKEGADVTFKVEDQMFCAHRIVIAMRSPVFKAELYGPMRDKEQRSITVEDMQPAVFKALLHYIYKDSLPAVTMENLDEDGNEEMVKLLLVAADRYAMERMKLLCENILCQRIDVGSVAAILALADQHHCSNLKDACIQFINSSTRLDELLASQGYEHLKRVCPTLFVDIWERSAKSRRM